MDLVSCRKGEGSALLTILSLTHPEGIPSPGKRAFVEQFPNLERLLDVEMLCQWSNVQL